MALKLGAMLAMTLMMASVKALDGGVPAGQIVFYRSAVTLLPLLVWVLWQGQADVLCAPQRLRRHLGRGLSGSASMFMIFVTLACLPLSEAVLLGYAAPLITVLLSRLMLDEAVPAHRWWAALLGAAGTAVALAPSLRPAAGAGGVLPSAGIDWRVGLGVGAGLAGALFAAISTVQIRALAGREPATAIVFHYTLTTLLIGLLSLPAGWVMPDGRQLLLLVAAGISSGLAQWLLALSLRRADASLLAPLDYSTLVWSMGLSALVFGQPPGPAVWAGAVLIAAAAFSAWWGGRRPAPSP
jgi:drug/metabolite transporter (DMT)-like permease